MNKSVNSISLKGPLFWVPLSEEAQEHGPIAYAVAQLVAQLPVLPFLDDSFALWKAAFPRMAATYSTWREEFSQDTPNLQVMARFRMTAEDARLLKNLESLDDPYGVMWERAFRYLKATHEKYGWDERDIHFFSMSIVLQDAFSATLRLAQPIEMSGTDTEILVSSLSEAQNWNGQFLLGLDTYTLDPLRVTELLLSGSLRRVAR